MMAVWILKWPFQCRSRPTSGLINPLPKHILLVKLRLRVRGWQSGDYNSEGERGMMWWRDAAVVNWVHQMHFHLPAASIKCWLENSFKVRGKCNVFSPGRQQQREMEDSCQEVSLLSNAATACPMTAKGRICKEISANAGLMSRCVPNWPYHAKSLCNR